MTRGIRSLSECRLLERGASRSNWGREEWAGGGLYFRACCILFRMLAGVQAKLCRHSEHTDAVPLWRVESPVADASTPTPHFYDR